MMVIDNLDDTDFNAKKYIPVTCGTILFTTRDKRLIGHPAYVSTKAGVEVLAMSVHEALKTLSRLLGASEHTAETDAYGEASRELLPLLEYLPLAIAQAAAFIRETHMELSQYLKEFKACEQNQKEFLSEALPNVAAIENEENTSRAVMTTWKITFENIQTKSPKSITLLELMSFLGPEEISEGLLKGAPIFINESPVLFMRTLAPLLSFNLLYRLESSNYRLHRLVACCVRAQMDSVDQKVKRKCLESAIRLISSNIPFDPIDDYLSCTRLLPHALATLQYVGYQGPGFKSLWNLQDRVGRVLERKGDYGGALVWFQRALDGRERVLGKDHRDTLDTIYCIALVFNQQREYSKALKWYWRVLDSREKTLGKDHPSTLDTVHCMAVVFDRQRKYGKALEWYQRALDGSEKTLGNDHSSTLSTVHCMAILFDRQRKYGKALEWYQRALDGKEKTLGKDHPSTLSTVHCMAMVFDRQRKYGKALEWYQRALDGRKKTLGNDHPDTLWTINNIAIMVAEHEGEYCKALEWFQRALEGREKAYGKDHCVTLRTVQNMAFTFKKQGENDKALEWYQRALDGYERTLGKDNPAFICTLEMMESLRDNRAGAW
jgi:tetratricopeptide (TPR) repeat protein